MGNRNRRRAGTSGQRLVKVKFKERKKPDPIKGKVFVVKNGVGQWVKKPDTP